MGMASEMDAVLLDCVTRGTVLYIVVRVIIDSILHTEHRFLSMPQYERNERKYLFHLLTCFTPSDF